VMNELTIENLSPERRALFELLLKQSSAVPQRDPETTVPLSYSQQRFWILQQLEPASSAFNNAAAIRLEGKLNIPALERTVNEIVRRHEVLRATFRTVEGRPVQVFGEPSTIKLPRTSLHDFKEREREQAAR